jgi:hypothetical protein
VTEEISCLRILVTIAIGDNQRNTTISRNPLEEGSARRRDLYRKTKILTRQIFTCPAGIEPAVLAKEGPQTVALDRSATGICPNRNYEFKKLQSHINFHFLLNPV